MDTQARGLPLLLTSAALCYLVSAQYNTSYRFVHFYTGIFLVFIALCVIAFEYFGISHHQIPTKLPFRTVKLPKIDITKSVPTLIDPKLAVSSSTLWFVALTLWLTVLFFSYVAFQRFLNAHNGLTMFYFWEGMK